MTVLVPLFFLAGCRRQEMQQEVRKVPVLVVSEDSLTVSESFSASISGQQDVEIYPQIGGVLIQVCVTEGQQVSKGQALFRIDAVPYEAALEQAVANVHAAEAALAAAQLDEESQQSLFWERVVGKYELQKATNAVAAARASLEQARALEKEARNNLSYATVKSPADGVVGTLPFRAGTLVGPQMAKPLTLVSDCSTVWAFFSVSEKALRNLQRQYGSRQRMLEAMPEVQLRLSDGTCYGRMGRIESVSGMVNPATGSVQLRASFPNPDRELLSGSIGEIILPQTFKNAVIIPMSATYEIQDHVCVSLVVNGKVQNRRVAVSRLNDSRRYVVTEGLKAGDTIVAEGASLVQDGEEVVIQK